MAIDASIYGQIQAPKFESPLNALAQVAQVKNAQNQNRLFDMKVAESERARADDDAVRAAYALDDPAARANALRNTSPKAYREEQTFQTTQQKAAREAEKERLLAGKAQIDLIGQVAGAARDPQSYAAGRAALQQAGIDVSNIPEQYDPAYVAQARNQALTASQQIEQVWKQKGYDLDVAKFGETVRNNKTQNGIAAGNLGVARQNAATSREKLDFDKSKPGKVANMSATMQKELFEADDTVQSSKNVIGLLDQALKLNDKAYSGLGAKERAAVRGQLPGDRSSADATINLDNIMTGQALESLKSVFGGMPTEGERKILLDIQASADKTPSQRKLIIDRARSAAQNRMKFNESKAKSLRDGSYTTTGPAPVEPEPNNIDSLLDKYK